MKRLSFIKLDFNIPAISCVFINRMLFKHSFAQIGQVYMCIDQEQMIVNTPKPSSDATFYDQMTGMTLFPFIIFILLAGPLLIGRFQKVVVNICTFKHSCTMPSSIHTDLCALKQVDEVSQAALDATFQRVVYYILFVVRTHACTHARTHARTFIVRCIHQSRSRCVHCLSGHQHASMQVLAQEDTKASKCACGVHLGAHIFWVRQVLPGQPKLGRVCLLCV